MNKGISTRTSERGEILVPNFQLRFLGVLLRELTHAPGFISVDAKKITVTLYPALTLQPKEKERLQCFLNMMADNIASLSHQSYEFKLHNNNPKATKGGISICDCHNLPTSSKY